MTHDTRYFTKPLWYYDPAAKQEMSIVFNPDTGELVHTDGVLPIESLLSIVRTDNSVMLLYNGHAGQTLLASSSKLAIDLEIWLKDYTSLNTLLHIEQRYQDFKALSPLRLSARVDCLYAPRDPKATVKAADILIVESGRSRVRYDLRNSNVRQRFLSECLSDSTTF